MGPTSEMTVRIAHTVTASGVGYTPWIYTGGFTKLNLSRGWTGTQVTAEVLQGTDAPISFDTPGLPEPTATEIYPVDNSTIAATITGGTSTAAVQQAFDNALPLWVRIQTTESNAAGGVVNYVFNFKSAS